jgi:hypothetical protein
METAACATGPLHHGCRVEEEARCCRYTGPFCFRGLRSSPGGLAMLAAMRHQNRPTSGGDVAALAFAVIAADRCRPQDSLPEIRDPLKGLSLFRPCPQLTRQVEIRTASVGVGCCAGSALVLERLSPESFCPFVHDVKTTSGAIRFRGPFTVPLREDVPHLLRSHSGSSEMLRAIRRRAPAYWRRGRRAFGARHPECASAARSTSATIVINALRPLVEQGWQIDLTYSFVHQPTTCNIPGHGPDTKAHPEGRSRSPSLDIMISCYVLVGAQGLEPWTR